MSHTPGPWAVKSDFIGPLRIESTEGTVALVGTPLNVDDENFGRSEIANAGLIAAAPDLLTALEELLNGGSIWTKDEHIARDAIKKAKG